MEPVSALVNPFSITFTAIKFGKRSYDATKDAQPRVFLL